MRHRPGPRRRCGGAIASTNDQRTRRQRRPERKGTQRTQPVFCQLRRYVPVRPSPYHRVVMIIPKPSTSAQTIRITNDCAGMPRAVVAASTWACVVTFFSLSFFPLTVAVRLLITCAATPNRAPGSRVCTVPSVALLTVAAAMLDPADRVLSFTVPIVELAVKSAGLEGSVPAVRLASPAYTLDPARSPTCT